MLVAPATLLLRWPMARDGAMERDGATEEQRKEEIKEGKNNNKKRKKFACKR